VVADGFLERHLASVRAALRNRVATAKKRMSQHFLLDASLLRRVVAAAGNVRDRDVVEIGPGPGGLTAALLEAGASVVAIELDPEWARATALALKGRGPLELKIDDALRTAPKIVADVATRSGRAPIVVSNLPYAIASPLIVDLVASRLPAEKLVVMVQREVADRIVAPQGSKTRGLLSLLVQLRATARRKFAVPAGAFVPPPKVDSAVVELVPDVARAERLRGRPDVEALMRVTFQARRKTLRRGLATTADEAALARVSPELLAKRPEELTNEQWFTLAEALAPAPAPAPTCSPS
jgi:16S rRNA (adenine1518-N6/adenine1519-N6)-dimethyltransferase